MKRFFAILAIVFMIAVTAASALAITPTYGGSSYYTSPPHNLNIQYVQTHNPSGCYGCYPGAFGYYNYHPSYYYIADRYYYGH